MLELYKQKLSGCNSILTLPDLNICTPIRVSTQISDSTEDRFIVATQSLRILSMLLYGHYCHLVTYITLFRRASHLRSLEVGADISLHQFASYASCVRSVVCAMVYS